MSTIRELAERTGIDRNEVSELVDMLREKGWVKAHRSTAAGTPRWELTNEGRRVLPPSTAEGYASIGGSEAQGLAIATRDYYLSKGWFFALARQEAGMKRKVDCVAYDYDRRMAVAVEIESSEHVFHDHIEQVKQHMMEISPFDEVHFWAHQDAAEKIMELRNALCPEDQLRVKVFAVGEDSSV
jgi:DNA-binding MarR family transcriptional regulator